MITFAVAATVLALLVLLAVVLPLMRGGASAPDRETFDRAVYRDQMRELERDAARGMIAPAEAAAARLEIQRRLLSRAGSATAIAQTGRNPALAIVLILLAASGAGGVLMQVAGTEVAPAHPETLQAGFAKIGPILIVPSMTTCSVYASVFERPSVISLSRV